MVKKYFLEKHFFFHVNKNLSRYLGNSSVYIIVKIWKGEKRQRRGSVPQTKDLERVECFRGIAGESFQGSAGGQPTVWVCTDREAGRDAAHHVWVRQQGGFITVLPVTSNLQRHTFRVGTLTVLIKFSAFYIEEQLFYCSMYVHLHDLIIWYYIRC